MTYFPDRLLPKSRFDYNAIIKFSGHEAQATISCDTKYYICIDRAVSALYDYFKKHRPTIFRIDFEVNGKIEQGSLYEFDGLSAFVNHAIDAYLHRASLRCKQWINEHNIYDLYDNIYLKLYKHLCVRVRDFKDGQRAGWINAKQLLPLMERIKSQAEQLLFFDRVTVQLNAYFREVKEKEQAQLNRMRLELSEEQIQELWGKIKPYIVDSDNQKKSFVHLIQGHWKPQTKITFTGIKQNEMGGLFYILYLFFHNKQESNIKAYTKTEIEHWIIANYAIDGVHEDNLNQSVHECFKRKKRKQGQSEKILRPEAKLLKLSFIDYTKELEWRKMVE